MSYNHLLKTCSALRLQDVANMFGPSVGARALTMRQALLVAAIFEFLGAVLMVRPRQHNNVTFT
jgi:hypothetical protein